MIIDCQNAVTDLVNVEHMMWKAGSVHVKARNYAALVFRIRGDAVITAGEKTYEVNTNDVLYFPQGISYTASYTDTEILVIHFHTAVDDTEGEIYTPADPDQMYQLFLRARVLWRQKSPGYEAYVYACLYEIFGKLCETETADRMPDYFVRALSYIHTQYADRVLSVETICRYAGISATQLRLLFRKYYQKAPIAYVTQLRLDYARMLISCGASVAEAAEQSGIGDPKYLARLTQRYYGCTPRELKSYGK